jgi:opacity protein-like surface antigen
MAGKENDCMRLKLLGAFLALSGLCLPATAHADGFLSPNIGVNFSGDLDDAKFVYGAGLGFMGGGIFGLEVDFAYSPEFFEADDGDIDFIDDSNLTTLMFNVIVGVPIGGQQGPGIRPYGTIGLGLVRSSITGVEEFFDFSSNDLGMNVGGGLMGYFSDHFGLRGDVRYFRSLTDPENDDELDLGLGHFDFWRSTVGVLLRF